MSMKNSVFMVYDDIILLPGNIQVPNQNSSHLIIWYDFTSEIYLTYL